MLQQSCHSACWFPPPTRQAAHRGRASKKSHMQEPDGWISGPCGRTLIWQIRFVRYAAAVAASLRRPASDPLSSPPLKYPAGSLAWKPSKSSSDPDLETIPQLNAALQALPSRPHQILTPFVRIHYPTGRRCLVRHQPSPPSCRRSHPRDRRSSPRSRPRRTLSPPAASLVVPTISSTFSSKVAITKFRKTKMAGIDSHIQHRHVTLKNLCT